MLWTWLACSAPPHERPAASDSGATFDPLAHHASPGPYAVGWAESWVTWQDALLGAPRELRVNTWYPTEETDGLPATYSGVFPDPLVVADAAVVDGPHPLVVFSHGHQGFGGNSSFLMRHLASHGWLVVAPDHTDNTTFDGPDRSTEIYWERPLDLRAVVDAARAAYDTTEELGAVGHSFGGYTMHAVGGAVYADIEPTCLDGTDTSAFCSTMDEAQAARFASVLTLPGVQAVVAMAPGDFDLFGAAGIAEIGVPELLLTGGLDPGTPTGGDLVWDALPAGSRTGLHVPTMGHQGFTDFSGTLGDPAGSIDPEEGWRIVSTAVSAFLDAEVRGDPRGRVLLDGTVPISDACEVRR